MGQGGASIPATARSTSSATGGTAAQPGDTSKTGGRRSQRLLARARRYLPPLVLLGILVSLVVNCARPLTNTDTYFHLRFGEEFLHGWSLRHPGSVSTFATQDWVPTQWLSEVVMARTEQWLGLAGLAWLSGLLEILLFVAVYAVVRHRAEPLVALPVTAASLYAMQSGLSMRPQVLSYLFVAVVVGAWLRTLDDERVRWWLVPLVWLWTMLHGMWPVALMVGGLATLGLALDRAPRGTVLRAAAVTVASAVAAAVTPVGPAVYGAVVTVGARSSYFAEWLPPSWTDPQPLTFAALLAATLFGMWRRGRNTWTETFLVALAGVFAAYAERMVPVGAAMLAPLAAGPLQALFGPRPGVERRERWTVGTGALVALVALGLAVPHTAAQPPAVPSWADPAVDRLPTGTKVLNDWGIGGYLMWRYPKLDLMMHGYGDTFTTQELDRNTRLLLVEPGWQDDLRASGARVALLRPWSTLASDLRLEGWRVVHTSDSLVMLRAPATWASDGLAVARPFPSAG